MPGVRRDREGGEMKNIDLTNKCGSCLNFKAIDGAASGECLKRPYGADVAHDPEHPHQIVTRGRHKCSLYNRKPQTNADRIRAMSDHELARFLDYVHWSAFESNRDVRNLKFPADTIGWKRLLQEPMKEDK